MWEVSRPTAEGTLVSVRPPRLAQSLMAWSLNESDRDVWLGDLSEEFTASAA
jgi:hypothetical protein